MVELTETPTTPTTIPASETLASLYYTREEVLQLLDSISDKTLQRLEVQGLGPPKSLLPGRRLRYRKVAFHEWLRTFEQTPRPARRRRRVAKEQSPVERQPAHRKSKRPQ